MFVKTVKFTRKKALLIVLVAAVILIGLVLLIGSGSGSGSGSGNSGSGNSGSAGASTGAKKGSALRTNADRVSYLNGLGWEVEQEPSEEKEVQIPYTFDAVYSDYNDLQKKQGFDLSTYCGKSVWVYSYEVTNYPLDGSVIAVLYLSNNRVIGGDIHSAALDGFMHGLK